MDYFVNSCGAQANGQTFDTEAIQAAIDRCHAQGGGRVVLEPGTYLSRTLRLTSNVSLHLQDGAVLQGGASPDDYDDFRAPGFIHQQAAEKNSKALICAAGATNIAITGAGEINGAGPAFYDTNIPAGQRFYPKPPIPRPRMIIFYNCQNVRLEDVALVDCPCWTVWLIDCEQVRLNRLRVTGDQRMINNDGIDIDSCRDVHLSDCLIKTGDDCIVVRAIQPVLVRPAVCQDVTVSNCTLDSCCQAIRVGCPSDNLIRRCTFRDLVIRGAGNGINIDNPRRYLAKDCNGRLDLQDIAFANLDIDVEGSPIRILVEEGIRLTRLANLTFTDIRARGRQPIIVAGCPQTPLEAICFASLQAEILAAEAFVFQHCRQLRLQDIELTVETPAP